MCRILGFFVLVMRIMNYETLKGKALYMIFGLFAQVFFHLEFVPLTQLTVDGFDHVSAKRQTSFAGRSLGRNKKKKIGKHFTTAINTVNIGLTGREGGEAAQQKQVGIFGRNGFSRDLRKQRGQ